VDKTYVYYGSLLNFSAECDDADLPEDELSYSWYSDLQGNLGSGEKLIGISLDIGVHEITLTVTDSTGESTTAKVTITVLKPESNTKKGGDELNTTSILIVGILIIILLLIFVYLNIKRNGNIPPGTGKKGIDITHFSFRFRDNKNFQDNLLKLKYPGKKSAEITKQPIINSLEIGKVYLFMIKDNKINMVRLENLLLTVPSPGLLITKTAALYKNSILISKFKLLKIGKDLEKNTVFAGNISKISNVIVYGKPGTGKTAVTRHVLDSLEKKANELGAKIKPSYINCRLSGTNYRVLAEICRSLDIQVPVFWISYNDYI